MTDVGAVAAPPMTVGPTQSTRELTDGLQQAGQQLALVAERGRTLGLATATEAFEQIAGELEEPGDVAGPVGNGPDPPHSG